VIALFNKKWDKWIVGIKLTMKKRAYFLKSLPLAIAALGAQVACFYLILLTRGDFEGQMFQLLPLFNSTSRTQPQPTIGFGNTPLFLVLIGLALAILSLMCLIASFRRREPGWGWRLIPIALLTLYLTTWVILLQG